jgi:hypothetical protein
MIRGVRLWNDRKTFYIQTNNAIEAILRRLGITNYLESCGPESSMNILACMGIEINAPSITGAIIQPGDFLTLWMNDPANRPIGTPDTRPTNEYAAAYPNAIEKIFGVKVTFITKPKYESISALVSSGQGAMLCLVTPGHFIAVVAYDEDTQELIYRDPWPARTKTDGFNLRMGRAEFESNVKPYAVIFGGP